MFFFNLLKPVLQKIVIFLIFLIKFGSPNDMFVVQFQHPNAAEVLEIEMEVLSGNALALSKLSREIEELKQKLKTAQTEAEISTLKAQIATKQSLSIALAQQGLNQVAIKSLEEIKP